MSTEGDARPTDDPPLIPARMLNEFVYCPRLAILEWAEGEFAHSADTVEGVVRHATVDKPGYRVRLRRAAPEAEPGAEAAQPSPSALRQLRSIELSDSELGLIAKIDLVEIEGDRVEPVDTKKGKRPHLPKGAYDPERVQVCAQGLLLRRHGYRATPGSSTTQARTSAWRSSSMRSSLR